MIKINVKFKTLLVMVSIKFTKDVVLGESIIQLLVTIVHVMENESVKLIVIVKEMLVIYLRLYKIFQKYAHAGLIFPQLSDEKIIPKLKLKFENKTFGIPVATPTTKTTLGCIDNQIGLLVISLFVADNLPSSPVYQH